jgi:hypothetical protein
VEVFSALYRPDVVCVPVGPDILVVHRFVAPMMECHSDAGLSAMRALERQADPLVTRFKAPPAGIKIKENHVGDFRIGTQ